MSCPIALLHASTVSASAIAFAAACRIHTRVTHNERWGSSCSCTCINQGRNEKWRSSYTCTCINKGPAPASTKGGTKGTLRLSSHAIRDNTSLRSLEISSFSSLSYNRLSLSSRRISLPRSLCRLQTLDDTTCALAFLKATYITRAPTHLSHDSSHACSMCQSMHHTKT